MLFWTRACALILALTIDTSAAVASPDEAVLGKEQGYPVAPRMGQSRDERYMVGSFSHMNRLAPTCTMAPSLTPRALPVATPEPALTYRYNGVDNTIDDYMQHQRVTGLLVIHDGTIVAERYGYDRTTDTRFLSNSMAKTVTALGILKAVEDGSIHSLEDHAAAYVPALAGTLYGETRLVDLLHMASGARFTEDYTPSDDRTAFNRLVAREGVVAAAQSVTERAAPAGTQFNYASAQTEVLGLVLRAATKDTLCHYIATRIWQPMGAELSADWLLNRKDGVEIAQGGLDATLRDYGRLGLLLAGDGQVAGQPVVSRDHILDMTAADRQPEAFRPGTMDWHGKHVVGYGLQIWLWSGQHRRFGLLGIYGQAILVDPDSKTVIVQTAVGKDPAGDASGTHLDVERNALFRGIVAHFGAW